jgi:hypothetical protein
MAIVLSQDVPSIAPVYNEMYITVNESNPVILLQDNYKFIAEVYVALSGDPIRFDFFPNVDAPSYGHVDIHRVLESYVNSFLGENLISTAAFGTTDGSLNYYRVEYGYSYIDNFGVYQEFLNQVTGPTNYFWEGVFDRHDFIDEINEATPYNDWFCNLLNGTNANFLTYNKNNKVFLGDYGTHQILTDTPADVDYMEVLTYDSSGALLGTFQIANLTPTARNLTLRSAPASLNAYTGAFIAGAQPIITSSVATYTIQIFEGAGVPVSEVINFELQEECRYEPVRLHFQNKLGAFDSFNFTKASKKTTDIKRKGYKKTGRNATAGSVDYTHNDATNVTYFTQSNDTFKINSDWLTEAEHVWLLELLTSNEIYWESADKKGDVIFLPVKEIKQKTYQEKTDNIDKLYNLSIDIVMSADNYRQRK